MPAAPHLQCRGGGGAAPPSDTAAQPESMLDLQTPSSSLRQHLDPEALPRPGYFESLEDLHLWYQMRYGGTLQDHLEPCSKHKGPASASGSRVSNHVRPTPKLAVCHDFKGGYTEDPNQRGYTLEHMHLVDTFIYFSHKRVSIPPIGWLTAAGRTATKVLGTFIFEWKESVPDMAQLLRGPERKAMPLRGEPSFSPQYAIELIQLALDRGFSGYLVNIEVALDLGFSCSGEAWPAWAGEQARIGEMHRNAERLRGWLHFLREEGTRRFVEAGKDADEWEVMWYDSVVYPHGQLAWQDALNEHNIPFFESAHTFFTNYTWARPPQPLPPGQLIDPADESPQTLQLRGYGLTGPDDGGFHPQLLLSAAMADSVDRSRPDVYVGIDLFGRNCWGGLKSWKSFDMIRPPRTIEDEERLNLSVALFAPGWTWEDENAGRTLEVTQAAQPRSWSDWWHIDEAFWIGVPASSPSAAYRITLTQDDVKPVSRYFAHSYDQDERRRRRANPLGFFTNFSLGSGTKWFDRGELVHRWTDSSATNAADCAGFTDMGVSMPKADLFALQHELDLQKGDSSSVPGLASSWRYDQERVWAGTASFVVSVPSVRKAEDAPSPNRRVALCSAVVPQPRGRQDEPVRWQFTMVYDTRGAGSTTILPRACPASDFWGERESSATTYEDLGDGWVAASCRFRLSSSSDPCTVALGFELLAPTEAQGDNGHSMELRIGALQLSPMPPPSPSPAKVLQVRPAAGVLESSPSQGQPRRLQAAILSWDAPESGLSTMYFNVWVQAVDQPATRTWLGTSTREATRTEFCVAEHMILPPHLAEVDESGLEYVITSLDILSPVEVAKGRATLI